MIAVFQLPTRGVVHGRTRTAATVYQRRTFAAVTAPPIPIAPISFVEGQLYDELTGALLYDELTGAPITI